MSSNKNLAVPEKHTKKLDTAPGCMLDRRRPFGWGADGRIQTYYSLVFRLKILHVSPLALSTMAEVISKMLICHSRSVFWAGIQFVNV